MAQPSAALYGQCGGKGASCSSTCSDSAWASCPSGSTCFRLNEWYWQCLPSSCPVSSSSSRSTSKTSSTKPGSTSAATKISPSATRASSSLAVTSPSPSVVSKPGKTTRYWDCCKPSCAWPGKAFVSSPVKTCSRNNSPLTDPNAQSGCNGGSAFACADQTPFAVNNQLSYGFAAKDTSESPESVICCACYELTFTSGPVNGKKMIVQITNTGGDLGAGHFDIAIPGGGQGIFSGCSAQFGSFPGAQYGGISSAADCKKLPTQLQAGCNWRFGWFQNADNPTVSYKPVTCPSELTKISGCSRK